MNKKCVFVLSVFLVLVLFLIVFLFYNKETDALKFKKEYEELNGTVRESDGAKYNSVKIDKNNPIKYISVKEALDVLDMDEAIIYVGASWCPWCRTAIPVLFEVAKEFHVDTIYYLNLDNDKSTFEVKDDKAVKTVDGSKEYYQLLDRLKDRLSDYILKASDGTVLSTNEKRIFMPYVIGVKNGRVVSDHTGTISLDDNQTKYSDLTKAQYDELKKVYSGLFEKFFLDGNNACNVNEVCD